MIRMTDTEDLIGPLPEMPKTPVAPTPWAQGDQDPSDLYDVRGGYVGQFCSEDVAELVVKLVNAAAAVERKVSHYVDKDGDNWWPVAADGLLVYATERADAVSFEMRTGTTVTELEEAYGPITAVYE